MSLFGPVRRVCKRLTLGTTTVRKRCQKQERAFRRKQETGAGRGPKWFGANPQNVVNCLPNQTLLTQQAEWVQKEPQLQWVFEFLARHWPTLLNAVESTVIPRANNAVEMVIRRFDRHYQNFCGFESIQTAQVYLGVFEIYRFTPFSEDAQPAIRGKSPLELAGYDLSKMPMPWLCRGHSLEWPVTMEAANVPSS